MSPLQPEDMYHKTDSSHYSNWCRICGIYYCWHEEANNGNPKPEYRHYIMHHPFRPMVSENDCPDWGDFIFIPDWLFKECEPF